MPESIEDLEAPLRRHAERAAKKIRACVAEDQRIARDASSTRSGTIPAWRIDCPCGEVHADDCYARRIEGDNIVIYDEGGHDEDQARHIVRHDPQHVLARSATLLDVLDELERIAERSPHPDPRMWVRLAICELARAWDLDEDEAPQQP